MLSKPKMPIPYNTLIDATKGITCSCVLTEGNISRYEMTIMDLYGNVVNTLSNEQTLGYWTVGNKITASVSAINSGLKNLCEYKWRTRLFEYQDVSVWAAYGTLQNVTTADADDIETPVVSTTGNSVTLKISAHQNIETKDMDVGNAKYKSFTLYKASEYFKDKVNYSPNPISYLKNANEEYGFIYLPDTTNAVNSIDPIIPKPINITETGTNNGIESIGIIDNIVPHPTLNGYCIVTVYDISGNIIPCLREGQLSQLLVYDNQGNKLPTKKRIRTYKLYKKNDEDNIFGDSLFITSIYGHDSLFMLGNEIAGEYCAADNYFGLGQTIDTQLSDEAIVISERDYQQSKTDDNTQTVKETYQFKYGGIRYAVTAYELMSPETETDLGIYTYGHITIENLDGSAIDTSVFKQDMQYTIYSNFIDSDEYYFKTHPNLFSKITFNGEFLDSETPLFTDVLEGELQGYLLDIDDKLYQSKIMSYEWTIAVPTMTGSEVIYKSGTRHGNVPYLKYSGFTENQDYLITLTITTDDRVAYVSETYTIRSEAFVVHNNDKALTVKYNNKKMCVDLLFDEGFANTYMTLAKTLSTMSSDYECKFERIDVYKTTYGTMCNKVASLTADELSQGHVEDYIIGSGNSYEYFVYPIFKFTYDDENNSIRYKYALPLTSNKVKVPLYGIAVIGLVPQVDENENIIENAYLIDYENIWHFYLDMKNDTSTFNMAHTLHEGQERFNKMSVGRRGYITSGVSALLGDANCQTSGQYVDNMDTVDLWKEFINNGELKIVCDQYGRILPVDIHECSYSYAEKVNARLCTVNFNYTQLADYKDIEVLFNNDYIELTDYVMLGNSYGQALSAADKNNENKALGAKR